MSAIRLAIGWIASPHFAVDGQVYACYELMKDRILQGRSQQPIRGLNTIRSGKFPVDVARNEVCAEFLASDDTHLLFIDLDHLWAPDLADRLLAHGKDVISARYHMRKPPFHACAFVKHRTQDGPHVYAPVHYGRGVFEIERGGAGALLLSRKAVQTIFDRVGHNWFRYQRGPLAPHDFDVSEDYWFFQQAREAGFTCWLDWDTEVKHLQTFAVDREWNRPYLDGQERQLMTMDPARRQAVLDSLVVCGYPDGITLADGSHVAPYQYQPGER